MKQFKIIKGKEFTGVDCSIEISLFDYGLIWKYEGDGEYRFIYGTSYNDESYFDVFDTAFLSEEHFESNYDWIELDEVLQCVGLTLDEWNERPFTDRIHDLISYYGVESIFGASYYGLTEILIKDEFGSLVGPGDLYFENENDLQLYNKANK